MLRHVLAAALILGALTVTAGAGQLNSRATAARPIVDVAAIPAYPTAETRQGARSAKRSTDANGNRTRVAPRESVESRVERSALVRGINAKLARWVKPTGKCGWGESETLTTYYNSGRVTANGERFRPGGLTAAHRTLAFGTILRVTNPHTGRSATVRINDRGPFTNAKLDLAQGAALAIGMRTSIYVCISSAAWASAQR